MNSKESEEGYKEATEIIVLIYPYLSTEKQKRQADRHKSLSSLKSMVLVMTKAFNIRYL